MAVVVGDNAYLRGTAIETGAVVDTLSPGTEVEIFRQQGQWFLVQASPFVGWMHRNSLRLKSTAKPEPATPPVETAPSEPTSDTRPRTPLTAAQPSSSDKRIYVRGPRGGCYYVRPDGKKVYGGQDQCSQLPLPESIKKTTASATDRPR